MRWNGGRGGSGEWLELTLPPLEGVGFWEALTSAGASLAHRDCRTLFQPARQLTQGWGQIEGVPREMVYFTERVPSPTGTPASPAPRAEPRPGRDEGPWDEASTRLRRYLCATCPASPLGSCIPSVGVRRRYGHPNGFTRRRIRRRNCPNRSLLGYRLHYSTLVRLMQKGSKRRKRSSSCPVFPCL